MEEKKYTTNQAHRFFAVEFNNAIFELANKKDINNFEKERIIQLGHAALLHWQKYAESTIVNTQRAFYMIAKAYVVAGETYNALKYAEKCFQITLDHKKEMEDFDLAYAYEMKARTAAMSDNFFDFEKYNRLALEQKQKIKNKEDLKYFNEDMEGGNWFGCK